MATGKITRLVRDRGFGFIKPDSAGEELFFHSSALQGIEFDSLNENQTVEFEEGKDPRNPTRSRAENVRVTA